MRSFLSFMPGAFAALLHWASGREFQRGPELAAVIFFGVVLGVLVYFCQRIES